MIHIPSRNLEKLSETKMRKEIGKSETDRVDTQEGYQGEFPKHVPKQLYASKHLFSLISKALELDVIDVVQHSHKIDRTPYYIAPESGAKGRGTIHNLDYLIYGL